MRGDQPSQPSRPDSEAIHLDRPNTAGAAREATFQRLRSLVLADDPARADASAGARASFASVDDETASLVYDSLTDDDLLAGVRSGTRAVRQLSFKAGELLLEVEVTGAGYLVGQVVPPQVAVVELRHRGGTTQRGNRRARLLPLSDPA